MNALFASLFEMWRLIQEEFGPEQTDKGDTLYWRWYWPSAQYPDSPLRCSPEEVARNERRAREGKNPQ